MGFVMDFGWFRVGDESKSNLTQQKVTIYRNLMTLNVWVFRLKMYGLWGMTDLWVFTCERAWWIEKCMGSDRLWGLTAMAYGRVDCSKI